MFDCKVGVPKVCLNTSTATICWDLSAVRIKVVSYVLIVLLNSLACLIA